MYPFKDDYTLLRDCWYVGALSSEVGNKPLGRPILDEPLVFYRTDSGQVVVAAGLCPHRFFPLSEGTVKGDSITCAYHGISFGSDGRCVAIPTQELIPPNARIKTYPSLERGGLVWVWTGAAEAADPALLPDLDGGGVTSPEFWVHGHSWRPLKGRYMSLCENLTDLSHIGALHSRSAPGAANHWLTVPLTITEQAGVMTIIRATTGPWNGFLEMQYGKELAIASPLHMHTQSDYYSHVYMRTSGFIIDRIEGQDTVPAEYGRSYHHHFITPATKTSTHYFGCLSRDYRFDDPAFDRMWEESDHFVRQEDVFGVEALEPYLDQFGDPRRELIVKADTGSVRFRRSMQQKLSAERERYAARGNSL